MPKIAAVQMRIECLKPDRNIQRALRLSAGVFKLEPDFICFPEIFITGPTRDLVRKFAQCIPGEYTEIFSKFASEHNVYVVMGSMIEKMEEKYYNTSVLISPEGDILGTYRKIFLWHPEKDYVERGHGVPVFGTKFGKIGIEICWDLTFPEITRELAVKGTDIVFCPAFWSEGDNPLHSKLGLNTESTFIDSCASARAIESELVFVFVNGCGTWELDGHSDKLSGHTQIALPFYGSISKLNDEEKVLITDIDLSVLTKAREIYSIIDDLKKFGHLIDRR